MRYRLLAAVALLAPLGLAAQAKVPASGVTSPATAYPLAPSPVLPTGALTRNPSFSGYVSVRETIREDTATFVVNRARLTVQERPLPYVAVRVQADFSAVGRTSHDTVPAISLTDAYIQLSPHDTASGATGVLHPAFIAGQFRTPFSLEYLTPFSLLRTANRSQAVDRLSTRRDLGVLGQVRLARVATITGAVVNGEGPNRTSNSDGRQMAVGRLTLFPTARLAVAAKWLGQGGDHRWGYDARWLGARLLAEGEVIVRAVSGGTAAADSRGGYVLVAYTPLTWLQPVVKWERLRETSSTTPATPESRLTWTTYGINFLAPQERLRLQLDWIDRAERPATAPGELVAQVLAVF